MAKFIYSIATALFFLAPQFSTAQIIEQMENESSRSSSESGNDAASFWAEVIFYSIEVGGGLFFGFPGEWDVSSAAIEAGGVELARYPYDDGINGLYRMREEPGYKIRTQVNLHYLNNEDRLHGAQLQVKCFPHPLYSAELNRLQLFEVLDLEIDELSFTNFFAQFNRIRHHKFHLWWGLGIMHAGGDLDETAFGVNTGFTWYIKKPVSLYADGQIAFGSDYPRQIYQLRLQTHFKRFKFYGGYEGILMGSFQSESRFHTPMWVLGTGIHF